MHYSEATTENKTVTTRVSEIMLRDDGILRIELSPVEEVTISDQKEIMKEVEKLGGGKAFCNLVVFKQYIQIDEETRRFSAGEAGNIYTIADAFVVNSIALKLIGSFYIQVNKPLKPTRIFTNEEDAIKWLQTFL